jgi:DNA repair exonuclease SbcCD ATPase subunit
MKIKRINAENFRGVRNATYELSDKTLIKGMNGSGKSTIPSMIYWTFVDRDVSLTANPQVRTIGAIDEQQTVVTIDCDFDGKPVQIQKSQKLKRSKAGTVALTNSYMINSVPKSEKDFKAYLTELGVDFDKFLPCSHPSVMLAGINNKKERTALRNLLFEMASDITDVEVAKQCGEELKELSVLLQQYEAAEIEAMQNATLRKIRENYGKEGEILRAKIEGMEKAKEHIDLAFHKEKADELSADIDKVKGQIELRQKEIEKAKDAQKKVLELSFKLTEIENRANSDRAKAKSDAEDELFKLETQKASLEDSIRSSERQCAAVRKNIEDAQNSISNLMTKRQKCIEYRFDASKAVCPTCGQVLPQDKLTELKAENERKAQEMAQKYDESIKAGEKAIRESETLIAENKKLVSDSVAEVARLDNKIKEAKKVVEDAVNMPKADMSENEEYQQTMAEKEEWNKQADETGIRVEIRELEGHIEALKEERDAHFMEIAKDKQNQRIDSKIAQLREDQKNYEQSKANAEMILYQLKTLNMKKNELLQESVNKNFNLISWRLFDFQKNGETFDTCIPMIDGKAFGESMNTALEIMAKIDAINGIQKFFGFDYPIILDDAEHLDSASMKKLETDHQLIMLCVSDDPELVFEKGGEE